ncbi:MAG: hypothetical protein L0332_03340 [Chloroflexi bacterium]|nr:hypothetical protein [Chloroflexota bacterium]MCI0579670.1 hypothetical protein [Chloroflexota bacterium]MCI0645890.1 hypothetical protein [Chloroflexota bacterium]MCI0725745.1 hypothetical protein [Chloroflexota bacterium]
MANAIPPQCEDICDDADRAREIYDQRWKDYFEARQAWEEEKSVWDESTFGDAGTVLATIAACATITLGW